jgi:hypothetical protein
MLEQTYRAIDREIGEMVEAAGERTRVLVFAPHGMGQLSHASWNLNEDPLCNRKHRQSF